MGQVRLKDLCNKSEDYIPQHIVSVSPKINIIMVNPVGDFAFVESKERQHLEDVND